MKNLQARFETKSNYQNLNGVWLNVAELQGTRITCKVKNEVGQIITTDFNIKEVVEFRTLQASKNDSYNAMMGAY